MTKAVSTQDVIEKMAPPMPLVETVPFVWSLDRYHRAIEQDVFGEDDPIELLFGQIITRMPVGELHTQCLKILNVRFVLQFRDQYYYQSQDPITLPDYSEPQPDYAVVTHKNYSKKTGQPGSKDIHLLIEVADSSLDIDRGPKARAYALAGIQEYWIINLKARQVELHLTPNVNLGEYSSITRHGEGSVFDSPFSGATSVSELLPPIEQEEE